MLIHLICVDAMRFDCMNWHPDRRFLEATGQFRRFDTPNLDRFCKPAARFTHCLSPAGYTALSLATTLTGTYARTHGLVDFTSTTLRPGVRTLFGLLREHGYRVVLHASKGGLLPQLTGTLEYDEFVATDAELIRLLHQQSEQSTIIYSHFNDLHAPYLWPDEGLLEDKAREYDTYLRLVYDARRADLSEDPPTRFVRPDGTGLSLYELRDRPPGQTPEALLGHLRRQLSAYYAGLERFDRQRFGPLFDELQRVRAWREGYVCLYADHGEAQRPFSNWSIDHGPSVEENLLRVPLVIRAPQVPPRMITDLVGLIDLFPTVLETVGLTRAANDLPYALDASSLCPVLRGERHGADVYWLEGWNFVNTSAECPPCVKSRALRYADGRKYTLWGQVAQEDDYAALNDEAFIRYAAVHTYGTNPTPWFTNRIRSMLARHGRSQVISALLGEVRQFRICDDVNADLLEQRTQTVAPGAARWHEVQPQLREIQRRTGTPHLHNTPHPDEARAVTDRMRALGYIA